MSSLWDTQVKIVKGVLLLNTIIGIVGIFFVNSPMMFLTGLLFGTIMSLLNFRLLFLTLKKAVEMAPHQARVYTTSRYMLRYFIMGMILYISIKADYIHSFGTILGVITLKLVVLQKELFNDKQYFKNIFKRKEAK
ncbi:ATP synthase subunit I [Natronincola ferrireducens]|uniref:ATP synthase I chain n=1 Tax=Natronincola ferrireducens TaxID=393762 RepID=A0A1G8XFT6_9FIRM|nr:ATP synthase subunit I [Natronincola ferrireducens]SDJ89353.1 ATP synthase I chain [Natronincola ferrireducens]